nr:serine/threonine-protein phosphatase 6 regulatory ankyrin repeat subunit C-like [Ziziphus jujuba var. spinosa]
MGSFPGLVTEPYRTALEGDWERMKRFYEENREAVFYPLTVTNDTPFHIAVYSRTKSPLEELIQIVPNPPIAKADDKKNTPLHEAGAIGNIEAAQVLMRCSPEQLEARNALGETPMFRAAAFGMTEMVKYLAFEVRSSQCDMHIQRIRDDNTSILHSAIQGQHFGLLSNEHDDDKCDQMNLRQCDDLESGWSRNHLCQSCILRFNRGEL